MSARIIKDLLIELEERKLSFSFVGDETQQLERPVALGAFKSSGLTFFSGKNVELLRPFENTDGGLVITHEAHKDKLEKGPFLFVKRPKLVFILLAESFQPKIKAEIHPTAIIDPEAKIAEDVAIGAYSVIGKVSIARGTRIGSHVSIQDHTKIGEKVKVFSGCRIGDPGLGSEIDDENNHLLFPHFAGVILEEGVVVGANSIINCGALTDTIVGKHSHISSNCLVAHNCQLGTNVYLAAGASIAGSSKIGDRCYLGFNACINDNITLAEGITVGVNVTLVKSYTTPNITLMNDSKPRALGNMFSLKRSVD